MDNKKGVTLEDPNTLEAVVEKWFEGYSKRHLTWSEGYGSGVGVGEDSLRPCFGRLGQGEGDPWLLFGMMEEEDLY